MTKKRYIIQNRQNTYHVIMVCYRAAFFSWDYSFSKNKIMYDFKYQFI